MTLLHDLPVAIAARIKTILPELRECKAIAGRYDLSRLKTDAVRAPGVLISIVDIKQSTSAAGPIHYYDLTIAAYILAKDAANLQRDEAAANITAAIAAYVPDKRWGRDDVGEALGVRGQSLVTATSQRSAVSLWAVSWTQPCALTASDAAAPLDPAIYVGLAPDIGPDHVDDYELVGSAP